MNKFAVLPLVLLSVVGCEPESTKKQDAVPTAVVSTTKTKAGENSTVSQVEDPAARKR